MLAAQPKAFFTIPHFDGWLACAPPNLANDYLEQDTARRG